MLRALVRLLGVSIVYGVTGVLLYRARGLYRAEILQWDSVVFALPVTAFVVEFLIPLVMRMSLGLTIGPGSGVTTTPENGPGMIYLR